MAIYGDDCPKSTISEWSKLFKGRSVDVVTSDVIDKNWLDIGGCKNKETTVSRIISSFENHCFEILHKCLGMTRVNASCSCVCFLLFVSE